MICRKSKCPNASKSTSSRSSSATSCNLQQTKPNQTWNSSLECNGNSSSELTTTYWKRATRTSSSKTSKSNGRTSSRKRSGLVRSMVQTSLLASLYEKAASMSTWSRAVIRKWTDSRWCGPWKASNCEASKTSWATFIIVVWIRSLAKPLCKRATRTISAATMLHHLLAMSSQYW